MDEADTSAHTGNHTAYKQFKGRRTPKEEVAELYEGLKSAGLNDFDMMLSGYCPSADVVAEVGRIAREKKLTAATKPGSFFWGTAEDGQRSQGMCLTKSQFSIRSWATMATSTSRKTPFQLTRR